MLEAYTGTCGSGKTYHAAYVAWDRLRFGHPVITNMSLTLPAKKRGKPYPYYHVDIYDLNPQRLREISEEIREARGWKRVPEDYIYLIVDEAQLIFNCREWDAHGRKEWTAFIQQHRKYGYHIIFVTQYIKMIDTQMRSLMEYNILHRKFSNFGLRGTFLSLLLLSPSLFACVRMWAVTNDRIDCELLRYSRRIGRLYNTRESFS